MKLSTLALCACVVGCGWLFAATTSAAELKVGDAAPVFEVMDDEGKAWKSSDYVGKKIVVVYFYPADCTGGCTAQAKGYRDGMKDLTSKDVVVVGVSGDTVGNHKLFKIKEMLNFPLLADVDGAVAGKFGVPFTKGEKTVKSVIAGKEESLTRNVTSQRWTFVIGKDGKIAHKNDKVKAADDPKAVAEIIAKLK